MIIHVIHVIETAGDKMIPEECTLEYRAREAEFKSVLNNSCVMNNLIERLKCEKEIHLLDCEFEVAISFSPLFDDLHIDIEDGIMRRV